MQLLSSKAQAVIQNGQVKRLTATMRRRASRSVNRPSATMSTSWCRAAPAGACPPAAAVLRAASSRWDTAATSSIMGRSAMVLSWPDTAIFSAYGEQALTS